MPSRGARLGAATLAAGLALLASACGTRGGPGPVRTGELPERPEEPRGVLVISIDGLRADRIQASGYDRATTPQIDSLAAQGVLFDSMIAAAPMPVPAHISLLTGCDPNVSRSTFRTGEDPDQSTSWRVHPGTPKLSLEFALAGYRTLGLADGEALGPLHGLAPGFHDLERPYLEEGHNERRGIERSTARLTQWLRSLDSEDSWFAYVHVGDLLRSFDAPDPRWSTLFEPREALDWVPPVAAREPALFALPPSRWSGGMQPMAEYDLRYDGGLARIDAAIGSCVELLRSSGRLEQTTIAIVGTFGMQFGEAGLLVDHGRLSVADLRVPLVLRPADSLESRRGAVLKCLASSMDLAPTLLELSGLDGRSMQGTSLWPVAQGAAAAARPYAFASGGLQNGFVVLSEEWALEELLAGDAAAELVRGWFGDMAAHPSEVSRRLYRWRTDSYPALVNGYVSAPPAASAAVDALGQARANWGRDVQALRPRAALGP